MYFFKSVTIDHFKNFGYIKVENFDRLTALQGANGCGKTAIIQATALAFGFNEDKFEDMIKDGTRVAVELYAGSRKGSIIFERRFVRGTSKYFMNNRSVKTEKYYAELAKLGIKKDCEAVPVFTDKCNFFRKTFVGEFLSDLTRMGDHNDQMEEQTEIRSEAIEEQKKFEDKKTPIELERATTQEFYLTSLYLHKIKAEMAKTKLDDLRESKKQACGKFKVDTAKLKRTRKSKSKNEDPESLETLEKHYQLCLAKRHYFLRQAQINRIEIPLLAGTVDVLTRAELKCISKIGEENNKSSMKAIEVKHTFSMDEVEKGSRVQINYDAIMEKYGLIPSVDRLEGSCQFLRNSVNALVSQQNWDAETAKLQLILREEIREDGDLAARWKRSHANNKMAEIKAHHLKVFHPFFQKVSQRVNDLYKDLCADPTREATLDIPPPPPGTKKDNHPWNRITLSIKKEGVDVDFQQLSGGEQTMAVIALKFAVADAIKAPVIFLDSVDSGVHLSNSKRLVPFLVRQSKHRQIIVSGSTSDFYKEVADEGVHIFTIQ